MNEKAQRILRVAAIVLTDKELEAWNLRYIMEWSVSDIAAATGADRSTVQRRVKRANAKVNAAIEEAA